MRRDGGVNADVTDRRHVPRREILGVLVSPSSQPAGNHRRCEERDVPRQRVERVERKVIRVRVRQEQRVERRQLVDRNARWRHAREEAAELTIEVGIGEKPNGADLDQ